MADSGDAPESARSLSVRGIARIDIVDGVTDEYIAAAGHAVDVTVVQPEACPKRMTFGPCGGVRPDGACEMNPAPCVFPAPVVDVPFVEAVALRRVPLVLADLSTPPFEPAAISRAVSIMAPACDALLVGEHHNRPDFPPTVMTRLVRAEGGTAWITLTCRDRNRVVLEQELRGLALAGAEAVLCVTGDGRAADVDPQVTQVWDLDGPRLTGLAASLGLSAAVAETPTAPPTGARALRLVAKQRAGAAVAVLNHVGRPERVAAFVAQARDAGLTIPVIAAVAVFTDAQSAATLARLPGLDLDAGVVQTIAGAVDPVGAGIAAAVDEAAALLSIPGVVGVNLSGSASSRGWEHGAQVKAEIAHRLGGQGHE